MAKVKQTEEYLGAQVESEKLRGLGVPEQTGAQGGTQHYGATNMPGTAKTQVDAMAAGGGIRSRNQVGPDVSLMMPNAEGPMGPQQPEGPPSRLRPLTLEEAKSLGPADPNPGITQTQKQYGKNPIYRNDNVDHDKYGAAIFSDSRRGATEGGFDESIAKGGAGAFDPVTGQPLQPGRKNELGHDMTLTDSYNRQTADIQAERQGRIDATRERDQGYGGLSRAQHEQIISNMFDEARGILKRLPYGSPKDKGRRASMVAEAKSLMGMAGQMQGVGTAMAGRDAMANKMGIANQQWNQEFNQQNLESDRRFGLDVLKAQKGKGPEWKQIGTGKDESGEETKQFGWVNPATQTVKPHASGGGAQPPPPPPNNPAYNWGNRRTAQVIKSQAEYSKLPSGAQFTAPDGSIRTKP